MVSFLHNFKLKTEVIIDEKSLLMTELNKYRVILLHFHKEILPSNVAEFPFQKLQYVQNVAFYCIRGKEWNIDLKFDDKESVLMLLHKNSALFNP